MTISSWHIKCLVQRPNSVWILELTTFFFLKSSGVENEDNFNNKIIVQEMGYARGGIFKRLVLHFTSEQH